MVVPAQLTAEAANQLREGIDLLLGRWSALQMAIQNEWGGRDRKLNSLLLMSINGLSDLLTSGGGGDSGVHDNPMARGEGNGYGCRELPYTETKNTGVKIRGYSSSNKKGVGVRS